MIANQLAEYKKKGAETVHSWLQWKTDLVISSSACVQDEVLGLNKGVGVLLLKRNDSQ